MRGIRISNQGAIEVRHAFRNFSNKAVLVGDHGVDVGDVGVERRSFEIAVER